MFIPSFHSMRLAGQRGHPRDVVSYYWGMVQSVESVDIVFLKPVDW